MSVTSRLHAELLRLARSNGEATAAGIKLRVTPTHAEFAARISTHREAVTRELSRLQKLGMLAKEDRALVVTDVEGLRELIRAASAG
jgi:CRP/FNR family transcriptional regulator, cyclic AMP receptor protein